MLGCLFSLVDYTDLSSPGTEHSLADVYCSELVRLSPLLAVGEEGGHLAHQAGDEAGQLIIGTTWFRLMGLITAHVNNVGVTSYRRICNIDV